MFTRNKNIKILVNYGLGPLLFIWFSYAIYKQVKAQPHLQDALHNLKLSVTGSQSWKIYLALLLVFVNWGVEARKWQVLMKPVESIGFFNAFKAVLAGLAFSMNTPNRIGEYGGRVLYVHEGHRWKAFSLTIIGSFSQLIVTLAMGLGGLVFFIAKPGNISGYCRLLFMDKSIAMGQFIGDGYPGAGIFQVRPANKMGRKAAESTSFPAAYCCN